MIERDLFVGAVSIGLGVSLLFFALTDHKGYFEMRSPSAMVRFLGRTRARCLIGFVGVCLVGFSGRVLYSAWGAEAISQETWRSSSR